MFTNLSPQSAYEAVKKRDSLLEEGALSLPADEGAIAVITSLVMNKSAMNEEEAAKLRRESLAIIDRLQGVGKKVIDVLTPTVADMNAIFRNPDITDVCAIGEGAIGNLYVAEGAIDLTCGTDYDWIDVSTTADHLKTGNIYQRMCSVVSFSKVVWGTFAAADMSKNWISQQPRFDPATVHSDPRQGLMTVYEGDENLSYDALWDLADALNEVRKVS